MTDDDKGFAAGLLACVRQESNFRVWWHALGTLVEIPVLVLVRVFQRFFELLRGRSS